MTYTNLSLKEDVWKRQMEQMSDHESSTTNLVHDSIWSKLFIRKPDLYLPTDLVGHLHIAQSNGYGTKKFHIAWL